MTDAITLPVILLPHALRPLPTAPTVEQYVAIEWLRTREGKVWSRLMDLQIDDRLGGMGRRILAALDDARDAFAPSDMMRGWNN